MRTMEAPEFEDRFLVLLEEVERGEEVTITRHGKVVARLVPAESMNPGRGDGAIAKLKKLRAGSSLDGLPWKDLRDEGRR